MNEPVAAFLDDFGALEDQREAAKILHPAAAILRLTLCGVIAGADGLGRQRGLRSSEAGTAAGDSAVCGRHSERRQTGAILPPHRSAGIQGGVRCFRVRPASRSGDPADGSGGQDVAAQSGGSRQGAAPGERIRHRSLHRAGADGHAGEEQPDHGDARTACASRAAGRHRLPRCPGLPARDRAADSGWRRAFWPQGQSGHAA
jgi:hypothetical protein